MKNGQIAVAVATGLVTVAVGILGWLLWRRYEQEHDTLRDEADLETSLMQQAMMLWFINRADEAELAAAGIRKRQQELILENRPFTSLSNLAHVSGVGRGTLRSVFDKATG